jgi:hypothetical protein
MLKALTPDQIAEITATRRSRGDYMNVITQLPEDWQGIEYDVKGTPFEGKNINSTAQSFKQNFEKHAKYKVKVWPNEENQVLYFIRQEA